jgi:hypothetical protein
MLNSAEIKSFSSEIVKSDPNHLSKFIISTHLPVFVNTKMHHLKILLASCVGLCSSLSLGKGFEVISTDSFRYVGF